MDRGKRQLAHDEILDFLATAPGKLPEDDWCYWCGKQRGEVAEIVVGPIAAICNECIELCVEILAEKGVRPNKPLQPTRRTTPRG